MCPKGAPDGKPLCINRSQLCDDKQDCEDGADEEAACCKCLYDYLRILSQKELLRFVLFLQLIPKDC